MAELIDKGALILHLKKIVSRESASDNASAGERRISEMVVSVILNCIEAVAEQPTTTESEIRAKAIEEFKAELLLSVRTRALPLLTAEDVERIAELTKERE